jgi:hypothetical protein
MVYSRVVSRFLWKMDGAASGQRGPQSRRMIAIPSAFAVLRLHAQGEDMVGDHQFGSLGPHSRTLKRFR